MESLEERRVWNDKRPLLVMGALALLGFGIYASLEAFYEQDEPVVVVVPPEDRAEVLYALAYSAHEKETQVASAVTAAVTAIESVEPEPVVQEEEEMLEGEAILENVVVSEVVHDRLFLVKGEQEVIVVIPSSNDEEPVTVGQRIDIEGEWFEVPGSETIQNLWKVSYDTAAYLSGFDYYIITNTVIVN